MKQIFILGIYNGHNATASLMKNGQIIAVASEERFTGKKNFIGFPGHAIDFVLKKAEIKKSEIDFIAVPFKYGAPVHASTGTKKSSSIAILILLYKPVNVIRKIWGEVAYYIPAVRFIGRFFYCISAYTVGSFTVSKEKDFLSKYFNIDKNKILFFDHHLSHAASAYYASPFNTKKALVLSIDGEGDTFSASVNVFENEKIKVISKTPRESSLGFIYAGVTQFLGMKANEHEYKVMGLAPYVRVEDVEKKYKNIEDIVVVDEEKLIFKTKFNTQNIGKFLSIKMGNVRFDLIAGVFQHLIEDKITQLVKASIKKTECHTVVLSGGVCMNVKMNQKIAELDGVRKMFIIPSSGDESSVLGASYLTYLRVCRKTNMKLEIPPIHDIYWGEEFSNEEILVSLDENKIKNKYKVRKVTDIEKEIAGILADGKIIARVSGRMEFGARALGNRSILADPRNPEVVRVINESVKNRDFWMPFAPSILKEVSDKYIKNPKKLDSPYMMITFDLTDKGKEDLRAAMHPYDFTVRPQLVNFNFNPKYYSLLKEFKKLTGIGAVLNTSFNLHGFPIVLGPKEALSAFENSGLKYLALEDYLISKR